MEGLLRLLCGGRSLLELGLGRMPLRVDGREARPSVGAGQIAKHLPERRLHLAAARVKAEKDLTPLLQLPWDRLQLRRDAGYVVRCRRHGSLCVRDRALGVLKLPSGALDTHPQERGPVGVLA